MNATVAMLFGALLIGVAGVLFYIDRTRPGKLAEILKTLFNRKGTP